VQVKVSDGPGITTVALHSSHGDIALTRPDGRLAIFTIPGETDRPVALQRRELAELLAEELRRLDNDDIYEDAVQVLARSGAGATRRSARRTESSAGAVAVTARKTSTTKRSGKAESKTQKKKKKKAPKKAKRQQKARA